MTAPADPALSTKTRTRRALLAGALGGAGALAASAIGRANPVRAADGDNVILGTSNTAANTTTVTATEGHGLAGHGPGGGVLGESVYVGVRGHATGAYGIGVLGNGAMRGIQGGTSVADGTAVAGFAGGTGLGVMGYSGPLGEGLPGPPPVPPKTGVLGYAIQDSTSRGVWGRSQAGVGVFGEATTGFALRTTGRLKVDKVSGVAGIRAGRTSVTVTPGVDVNASSFVLLTPKVNLGGRDLWFTTNPTANTFTIWMSRTRPSATKVAWLLLG